MSRQTGVSYDVAERRALERAYASRMDQWIVSGRGDYDYTIIEADSTTISKPRIARRVTVRDADEEMSFLSPTDKGEKAGTFNV